LVCITIVSGQTPFKDVAAAGAGAATALGEGTTDAAAAAEGDAAGLATAGDAAGDVAGAALAAGAVVGLAAAGGAVVGAGGGAAGAQPATIATAAMMGSVELSHGERGMRIPPLK
jgi:hypothetical protein